MQQGHGHAAKTWAYSMDLDMQHGDGHAAYTGTYSMDMDMHTLQLKRVVIVSRFVSLFALFRFVSLCFALFRFVSLCFALFRFVSLCLALFRCDL